MQSSNYNYSAQAIVQTDLERMASFILKVAKANIRWHANYDPNPVKDIILCLVRKKIPSYIKEAILQASIDFSKHTHFIVLIEKFLFNINAIISIY